jgi:hypothetical protein
MSKIKIISPQQAHESNMFGPIYHGTSDAKMKEILKDGFKIFVGDARSSEISNGYKGDREYAMGAPAPIHHLVFGIYFTTNKSIAKKFGHGVSPKHSFYLTEKPHEINFGSPNNMMKWWLENGYDIEIAKKDRVAATNKLTNALKKKYKAIWFKGKGLRSLLDGDQVVVFDISIIRGVDDTLAKGVEVGSKVERFQRWVFQGTREQREDQSRWVIEPLDPPKSGVIQNIRNIPEETRKYYPPGAKEFVEVKYDNGGRDWNSFLSEFRQRESKRVKKSNFQVESAIVRAMRLVTENFVYNNIQKYDLLELFLIEKQDTNNSAIDKIPPNYKEAIVHFLDGFKNSMNHKARKSLYRNEGKIQIKLINMSPYKQSGGKSIIGTSLNKIIVSVKGYEIKEKSFDATLIGGQSAARFVNQFFQDDDKTSDRYQPGSNVINAIARESFFHECYKENILLEKKGVFYKHAIAMFDMPKKISNTIKKWQKENIDEVDIYTSDEDNSLGLEDEIHATILYGLKNQDMKKIKDLVADFGPVELELDGLVIFDNADNNRPFDVLNVNVNGEDIKRLHNLLKSSVENYDKWPDFKAHVCIAYLKKGTGDKYRDLDPPFKGEKVTFDSFSFKTGGSKDRKKINVSLNSDVVTEAVLDVSSIRLRKDILQMLQDSFPKLASLVKFEDNDEGDLMMSVSLDETPAFQSQATGKGQPLNIALKKIAKKYSRMILPEGNNTIVFIQKPKS